VKGSRSYDAEFYHELEETRDSARVILPVVVELLHPGSIVDLGCGAGHWLAAAIEIGITDVQGIEGEWILGAELAIPRDQLLIHDLTKPLHVGRKFDLALSLEVAEHLPASAAALLVKSICASADRVLFSAAVPGQGGRHHLNEQWPSYWANLFAAEGYGCYDVVRPVFWEDPRVKWYYAQNCLIFARPPVPASLGKPAAPRALVHPAAWNASVMRWNSPGKLIERLPKAVWAQMKSPR
jgi:SAM-dependent methyltransferase